MAPPENGTGEFAEQGTVRHDVDPPRLGVLGRRGSQPAVQDLLNNVVWHRPVVEPPADAASSEDGLQHGERVPAAHAQPGVRK